MAAAEVLIYTGLCKTCGHWVTAIREESADASMLAHIAYVHGDSSEDAA